MEHNMFCFQCEQTAGCSGCTGASGVCGKNADTALLQDELTGALIGLARAAADDQVPVPEEADQLVMEGLFATLTNVNFNNEALQAFISRVRTMKKQLLPNCPGCPSQCSKTQDYDLQNLWNADEDIRSLKSLILFGIRGVAAYAYHAAVLGYTGIQINTAVHIT